MTLVRASSARERAGATLGSVLRTGWVGSARMALTASWPAWAVPGSELSEPDKRRVERPTSACGCTFSLARLIRATAASAEEAGSCYVTAVRASSARERAGTTLGSVLSRGLAGLASLFLILLLVIGR